MSLAVHDSPLYESRAFQADVNLSTTPEDKHQALEIRRHQKLLVALLSVYVQTTAKLQILIPAAHSLLALQSPALIGFSCPLG
jgi:hypothetical protein